MAKRFFNPPMQLGQRFGRLVVVSPALPAAKDKRKRWLCHCDCGTAKIIPETALWQKNSQSCGCRTREAAKERRIHGKTNTPLHHVWRSMKTRCLCPTDKVYPRYGGRGITVCQRWRDSFEAFESAMGPKPGPDYSVERKDNNGNYSCGHCQECREKSWPANCKWATIREQNLNQRRTHFLTIKGKTMTLSDWARISNLDYMLIYARILRGWPTELLLAPLGTSHRRPKLNQAA